MNRNPDYKIRYLMMSSTNLLFNSVQMAPTVMWGIFVPLNSPLTNLSSISERLEADSLFKYCFHLLSCFMTFNAYFLNISRLLSINNNIIR